MAIDGNWKIDMETPMGTQSAQLQLASTGGKLTGKMLGGGGAVELADGLIDGNKASWKADIKQPMALTLEFSVTVDGAERLRPRRRQRFAQQTAGAAPCRTR
jgi:hypothetical protein